MFTRGIIDTNFQRHPTICRLVVSRCPGERGETDIWQYLQANVRNVCPASSKAAWRCFRSARYISDVKRSSPKTIRERSCSFFFLIRHNRKRLLQFRTRSVSLMLFEHRRRRLKLFRPRVLRAFFAQKSLVDAFSYDTVTGHPSRGGPYTR